MANSGLRPRDSRRRRFDEAESTVHVGTIFLDCVKRVYEAWHEDRSLHFPVHLLLTTPISPTTELMTSPCYLLRRWETKDITVCLSSKIDRKDKVSSVE